jgi:hypothetical protein
MSLCKIEPKGAVSFNPGHDLNMMMECYKTNILGFCPFAVENFTACSSNLASVTQ